MRRFVLLMMLGAVACGSDDPKTPDDTDNDPPADEDIGPGAVAIAFAPASIAIAEGAAGTVRFAVTRTGQAAEGDVAYSVAGVPNGIAFAISGDDMTLKVPFFAQNRDHAINVTATANNGRKATASFTLTVLPPAPLDVRGRVVAFDTGLPIEGFEAGRVEVAVWGRNATTPVLIVPTDDTFAVDDVTPPYDVMITFDNIGLKARQLMLGIGRADPTIVYYGFSSGRASLANHQFQLSVSDPNGVGYDHLAFDIACASGASRAGALDAAASTSVLGPTGSGPTSCTGQRFAFDVGAVLPEDFSPRQSTTASVTLDDGGSTDFAIAAGAANSHGIAVSYTAASGFAPLIDFQWLLGDQRTVSYFQATAADPITELVAPGDAAIATGVCLSGAAVPLTTNPLNAGGSTVCRLTPSTAASVAFGTLTGPANTAAPTGITARGNLVFNALNGFGAYVIEKLSPPEEETFVFTNGPINAQTMARHALALEPSVSYQWRGFKLEGVSSMDAFVTTDVTMRGFLTRQAGYSLGSAQSFGVTN